MQGEALSECGRERDVQEAPVQARGGRWTAGSIQGPERYSASRAVIENEEGGEEIGKNVECQNGAYDCIA